VNGYYLTSPESKTLVLTKEVFEAFEEIIRRSSGSVTVQFRAGGVAGVTVTKVYK